MENSYKDMYDSIDNVWSLLFTTGYLTHRGITEQHEYILAIPNKEIRNIFTDQIFKWFQDTARKDGDTLHAFCNAFKTGEWGYDSIVPVKRFTECTLGLIGFGTEVKLHDNLEDKDITYTFMGRWESEPEKGIIDFNAPLGQKLVNHKEGEDVKFEINGRAYDLTVVKIEPVQF